ncbi:MAG: hypothetical protein ACKVHP_00910 [Verrucomicrobiales bacterium]
MAGARKSSGKNVGPRAKKTVSRLRTPQKKKRAVSKEPVAEKKRASKRSSPRIAQPAQGWLPTLTRVLVTVLLIGLAVVTRVLVTVLLIGLVIVTMETFFESIAAVRGVGFWKTAPVYFFGIGMGVLWGFREGLLYLYVFGHEFTHVIFIYLCGGKVYGDIRVSTQGGHVVTNKTNWLISLSPYFVPFYTVIAASGFLLARPFVDLNNTLTLMGLDFQPIYFLYGLIGFTWALHIFYTVTMLAKDQPDLHMNGNILSLLVIYLVNSIIVMSFVAFASSSFTLRGFITAWFTNAHEAINVVLIRVAGLIW